MKNKTKRVLSVMYFIPCLIFCGAEIPDSYTTSQVLIFFGILIPNFIFSSILLQKTFKNHGKQSY